LQTWSRSWRGQIDVCRHHPKRALLWFLRKTDHEQGTVRGWSDPAKVPEIKGYFEVAPIVGGGFCLAAATSLGYWATSTRIGWG
jgi:hypothetical protein